MTTERDDLVLRPKLLHDDGGAAPVTSKFKRRGRGGRLTRSMLRQAMGRLGIANVGARARGMLPGTAGGAGRLATAARAASILAAAGIAAARLMSGRSFENMGANAEMAAFGSLGPEAAASARARAHLAGNPLAAGYVGQRGGGVPDDLQRIYKDLFEVYLIEEKGRQQINAHQAFQTNGTMDMIILGAERFVKAYWREARGDEVVQEMARVLKQAASGMGAGR